ncbi:MAG: glycosyltransferase [Pirellulaceae bacterium]
MSSRSLLLVSKRFWPMAGPLELLAAALARQFVESGHRVDVVASHFVRQWPDRFQMGGVHVHRVPRTQRSWSPATLGYYGRNRWLRGLQRWITTHRRNFDAAVILESSDEQFATAQAVARLGMPAVVRIGNHVLDQLSPATEKVLRSLVSTHIALVTPDHASLSQWETGADTPGMGVPSIQCVPDGSTVNAVNLPDQHVARQILARTHPIFHLDDGALLAISPADLTFDSGVFGLVRAWRRVLAAHPSARLWLIGNGENAPELFQRICDLDMQHAVLIPGNFDDVSELFQAADACILPGTDDRADWYVNTALGQQVTIIHHQRAPAVAAIPSAAHHIPFDDDLRTIDLVVNRWANATTSRIGNEDDYVRSRSGMESGAVGIDSMKQMADRYLLLAESLVHASENAERS